MHGGRPRRIPRVIPRRVWEGGDPESIHESGVTYLGRFPRLRVVMIYDDGHEGLYCYVDTLHEALAFVESQLAPVCDFYPDYRIDWVAEHRPI